MFNFKLLLGSKTFRPIRSSLYDESSFYKSFMYDLSHAKHIVIIESPFITMRRLDTIYPDIQSAVQRGVRIIINTRDPETHDIEMYESAALGIVRLQSLGIEILYTGNLHRKLALIDHTVMWEGSLNILSQSNSSELMRRTESPAIVKETIAFIKLGQWYN